MCGIFAIFSRTGLPILPRKYYKSVQSLREISYRQSGKQRHRGPDDTGVEIIDNGCVAMVHERLGIIGPKTGHQPLKSSDETVFLVANGEIYNYLELSAEIAKKRGSYSPRSDCNVIVELYEEYGEDLFDHITGMYAFALYDTKTQTVLIARDPVGIIPMYYGEDADGNIWISSELKCLVDVCEKVDNFPPGYMRVGQAGKPLVEKCFYKPEWIAEIPKEPVDLTVLRQKLESAVRTHLQSDVEFAALLSGGVDSSLIASMASKIKKETEQDFKLKTFSVGLPGAPDFKYSRMVADYIGSDHTEVIFSIDDGLDCIRDIIWHLETYDITTVRCSIPMILLMRSIKALGIKMILSGEGADELFGGYLYFFQAPNTIEFHKELVSRVQKLHHSDCLRGNKVAMAKGIELRVPFLDTEFVNYVMAVRPDDKIPGKLNNYGNEKAHRIEKHVLRAAFANNYLPDEVLWRQKEQFSDGVGYNWIDTIKAYATSKVTDEDFALASKHYPYNTPATKEAYYYRSIFDELFPGEAAARTVQKWLPRTDWGCSDDPSGRAQLTHSSSTVNNNSK